MKKINRRDWLKVSSGAACCPALGFQLHLYANPAATKWLGWITWFGRVVGFVRLDKSVLWGKW